MADPNQLPPHFVGRYPGAPIPVPLPVAPNVFASRQDFNAHGTTSGAVPVFTPVAPAPGVVAPANAASVPASPGIGLALTPAPAPTQKARDFVNSLPTLAPPASAAQPAAQPPIYDASGNEQVNLPPLVNGEIPGTAGGAVSLPGDVAPNTNAAAPVAPQGDENMWRPAQTQPGSNWSFASGESAGVPGGAGTGTAAAITGGRLLSPGEAIQRGYDQQQAYQASALQALMNLARQGGSPLNASFRFAHLAPAFAAAIGNNNFGGVQAQGADALNSAISGVSSTGISADASNYAQQQANARAAAEVGLHQQIFEGTPVTTGTRPNPLGPLYPSLQEYGLPKLGGGQPSPVGATADRAEAKKFIPDGAKVTQGGVTYVRQNGQWARAN